MSIFKVYVNDYNNMQQADNTRMMWEEHQILSNLTKQ